VVDHDETHQSMRAIKIGGNPNLARIVVLTGDRAGRKVTLDRELVFGRSRRAGLQLDDPQVSRHHARIRRIPSGFQLEDLQSRNGTALNGEILRKPTALTFGDRIQIGSNLLLFTHVDPLEDQVAERQKLEAIGRLGTGIAHDFNNLLGAVRASLDYLDELENAALQDEAVRASLDDIRTASDRACDLTRRLLGFARRTHRTHGPVDVADLGQEVLKLLARTSDRAISLETEIVPAIHVRGDRSHLHQLLMNLCINARDAMPEGGRLMLKIRQATEEDLVRLPYRDRDAYVLITVEDTGIGMDEETRKRLFEPFFTTKADEAGAGLGLATVYEVVDAHGGYIDVDSAPNQGTTFLVFLPQDSASTVRETADTPAQPGAIDVTASRPSMQLLLVDDEDVMRRSASRLLRKLGHVVEEAVDGQDAVERFEAADPKPDVVVLDLNMPRMGGLQALVRMREIEPHVEVIVVSGYLENDVHRQLREAGVRSVLHKPFDLAELRVALASVPR